MLSELVEVDLGKIELIPDFVYGFANQFKHLLIFTFKLKSDSDYVDYFGYPNNGWNCAKIDKQLVSMNIIEIDCKLNIMDILKRCYISIK